MSRIVVLLVNCTFTFLMSCAPFFLASATVSTPCDFIVSRNEPKSPSRTLLPFSSASITSYCSASNTAFTSALDTVERFFHTLYYLCKCHRCAWCHLRIILNFYFLQWVFLPLNNILNHNLFKFKGYLMTQRYKILR